MSRRRLHDLARMLAVAAGVLERAPDPEAARLLGLMRQTVDGLEAAAARLDAASAQGLALDAKVLADWRHDLVAPITAMVGWARLFGEARDPTARIRASEAIERNAKELVQFLAEPFGPARPRD